MVITGKFKVNENKLKKIVAFLTDWLQLVQWLLCWRDVGNQYDSFIGRFPNAEARQRPLSDQRSLGIFLTKKKSKLMDEPIQRP